MAGFLIRGSFIWSTVYVFFNLKFPPINIQYIGPLQDPVTWYRINYAGTQVTQWDFQNKGKSGWTGTSSFVLEVPLCYLRPSIVNSVPCDRILQRAYCSCFFVLLPWPGKKHHFVMPSRAITCHSLMSLQIASRETSDKLTTFGCIFMRTYQIDCENETNACGQILLSSLEGIRTPFLRQL